MAAEYCSSDEDVDLSSRLASLSPSPYCARRRGSARFPLSATAKDGSKRRRVIKGVEADSSVSREVVAKSKGLFVSEFHSEFPHVLAECIEQMGGQLSLTTKVTEDGFAIACVNGRHVFYWHLQSEKCQFSQRPLKCWCVSVPLIETLFEDSQSAVSVTVDISDIHVLSTVPPSDSSESENSGIRRVAQCLVYVATATRTPKCSDGYSSSGSAEESHGGGVEHWLYAVKHSAIFQNTRIPLADALPDDGSSDVHCKGLGLERALFETLVKDQSAHQSVASRSLVPLFTAANGDSDSVGRNEEYTISSHLINDCSAALISTSLGRVLHATVHVIGGDEFDFGFGVAATSRVELSQVRAISIVPPAAIREEIENSERLQKKSAIGSLLSSVMSTFGFDDQKPTVESLFEVFVQNASDTDTSEDCDSKRSTEKMPMAVLRSAIDSNALQLLCKCTGKNQGDDGGMGHSLLAVVDLSPAFERRNESLRLFVLRKSCIDCIALQTDSGCFDALSDDATILWSHPIDFSIFNADMFATATQSAMESSDSAAICTSATARIDETQLPVAVKLRCVYNGVPKSGVPFLLVLFLCRDSSALIVCEYHMCSGGVGGSGLLADDCSDEEVSDELECVSMTRIPLRGYVIDSELIQMDTVFCGGRKRRREQLCVVYSPDFVALLPLCTALPTAQRFTLLPMAATFAGDSAFFGGGFQVLRPSNNGASASVRKYDLRKSERRLILMNAKFEVLSLRSLLGAAEDIGGDDDVELQKEVRGKLQLAFAEWNTSESGVRRANRICESLIAEATAGMKALICDEIVQMSESILNCDLSQSLHCAEDSRWLGREQLETKLETWARFGAFLRQCGDSLWTKVMDQNEVARFSVLQNRELLEASAALFDLISAEFETVEDCGSGKGLKHSLRCAFLRAVVESVLATNGRIDEVRELEDGSALPHWQCQLLDALFLKCAQINSIYRFLHSVCAAFVQALAAQKPESSGATDALSKTVGRHLELAKLDVQRLDEAQRVYCQTEVLSLALAVASTLLCAALRRRTMCQALVGDGSADALGLEHVSEGTPGDYASLSARTMDSCSYHKHFALRSALKTLVQTATNHCTELQRRVSEASECGPMREDWQCAGLCQAILRLSDVLLAECIRRDSPEFEEVRDFLSSFLFRVRHTGDVLQAMDAFALKFEDVRLLSLLCAELRATDSELFAQFYCRNLAKFGWPFHKRVAEICQFTARNALCLDVLKSKAFAAAKHDIHEFEVGGNAADDCRLSASLSTFVQKCVGRRLSELRRASRRRKDSDAVGDAVLRYSWMHCAHCDEFADASRHLRKCGRLAQSTAELSLAKLCRVAHAKEDAAAVTVDSDQTVGWFANIEADLCVAAMQREVGDLQTTDASQLLCALLAAGVADVATARLCLKAVVSCQLAAATPLRLLCALVFGEWQSHWCELVERQRMEAMTEVSGVEPVIKSTVFCRFTAAVWLESETQPALWQTWNHTVDAFLANDCQLPEYKERCSDELLFFVTWALSFAME